MNGMRLNRSGLNMSRLNASLLNASGIGAMGCKGKATMEDRIRESMVVWYDLAKQGATNEGMAADPRIIDHSGNGHHAACHNFAWSGMSGIGGYLYDFMNWNFNGRLFVMERTSTSVHVDGRNEGVTTATFLEKYLKRGEDTGTFTFPSLKIRVQNPNGFPICSDYYYNGLSTDVFDLSESGTYTIPERTYEVDESMSNKSIVLRFRINTTKADAGTDYSKMNVTIELLPEYPGALVSDGVDDYAQTQPFHIPKEFTVMWDVDWLGEGTSANSGFVKPNSFFVYRGDSADNIIAFINNVASYDFIPKDTFCISGLTAYDKEYNAVALTDAQDVNESTDYLGIFRGSVNSDVVSMAFRKFLLFDRVLTLEEIEWVKTNLMSE